MPRPRRLAPGGLVYHVLNRANGKKVIFERPGDYQAFESLLAEIQARVAIRVLAWCLMPNHWHLILWPTADGVLSDYMRLLTLTHTQRWHAFRSTAGTGHLYQGRFKSFVVSDDHYFLTVCRYVEANALRARLVDRAEHWRWSSLWHRENTSACSVPAVTAWPCARPKGWLAYVNEQARPVELATVRKCAQRGTPYGDPAWAHECANRLGLTCKLRGRGRPPTEDGAERSEKRVLTPYSA